MVIVDSHVHLYPSEINLDPAAWAVAQGEPHWAQLCTRRRTDGRPVQGFPNVATLLRSMDDAGVGRAILLGWYWQKATSCVMQNRFYAECIRAHPDRLSAFATVNPRTGRTALDELRRALDDGLVGLGELSPHSQQVSMEDPVFNEMLALAGERGLPVNLHVTDPASTAYVGRVETPLVDFVRLAKTHPGTTFILAHWGGGLDVRGLANVWVDTAASPLIYRQGGWNYSGTSVAVDRILFGTDFPLVLYPRQFREPELGEFIKEVRVMLPDAARQEAVLGGNAVRLFNLPAG